MITRSWRRSLHSVSVFPWPQVRRAKLGFVSRRQVPAPEVLARHRVPRVASLSVTPTTKRTQGGDGPQCASVKGWSPVRRINCGCRRRLWYGRQHPRSPIGHGSRELTGVEDRGTSPRQSRELGRSHGFFHGRKEGGTTGKPGGSPMVHGKSDVPIRARTWGNAHRAQGGTCSRPFDGNAAHTQRWSRGDNGSRTDSQSGSAGTADAIHVADAPRHGG
jgi:hypothetical protein